MRGPKEPQPILTMPLTYSVTSRGYRISYRDAVLGGAGISASAEGPRGRSAQKQREAYAAMALREIKALNDGAGRFDYYANIVKAWLAHHGHKVGDAVAVKIYDTAKQDDPLVLAGAWYESKHFEGVRLCVRATNGKELSNRRVYVLADGSHWYVAGYSTVESAKAHPETDDIGCTVVLCKWDLPEAIDKYEARPYRRVPMVVSKELPSCVVDSLSTGGVPCGS